ncbi:DUF1697 domain-containing protein [Flavobacterium suzhouense]|uniref:DUF1697 domain-containing protein n=1 Tax=Flavobacterium suzhouense TaxID=1529638 RepID=A0ABW5NV21_9FLAO
MNRYLALLRGINVSGKNIIRMESLRTLMENNGFRSVKTYIQSGNVVFESDEKSKDKLKNNLSGLIKDEYGFDITVFIINKNELETSIDSNPFTEWREEEPSGFKKLYVTFLSDIPTSENIEKLLQAPIGNDLIEIVDNILYFKLESKASDSKLSNNLIETKLKLKATTRNWNTTLKLLSMME